MRIISIVSAALVALASAGVASADDDAATSEGFAALKGVKAIVMEAGELEAVKGQHIHFTNPGGFHVVNHKENNLGGGQAHPLSGPGYSGLCVALTVSGGVIQNVVPC